jgi:hypothetical protein
LLIVNLNFSIAEYKVKINDNYRPDKENINQTQRRAKAELSD